MDDQIRDLVARVRKGVTKQKTTKSNRTLSLAEPQFRDFQAYCRGQGTTASEVIDDLIRIFMASSTQEAAPPKGK